MAQGSEESAESECLNEEEAEMVKKGNDEGIGNKPLKSKVGDGRFNTGLVLFARGDKADDTGSEIGCKNRSCGMDAQGI